METLNEARLSVVLQQYLENGRVLSPLAANEREPVFMGENCGAAGKYLHKSASRHHFLISPDFERVVPIRLGVRLQEVVQR